MSENEINAMLEQQVLDYSKGERFLERIQYVMDFGEVTVQYDFCLN